jgi:GNAT superfamily N-acetyltransferase
LWRLATGVDPVAVTALAGGNAVLAHVAVRRERRGRGVGAALVERFVEQARARRVSTVRLVTRVGEEGAGGFYAQLGWHLVGQGRDREGVTWARYRLDLTCDW